jgi:hypothetical protein
MARGLGTPGGVVTDEDHRLAQGGLVALNGSGMAVRTGVLSGPGTLSLISGTAATGTMTVTVAAHHWVTSRGNTDGIYLGAVETATTVNIAAAPGANSRIDLIYDKQNDSGSTITPDGSTTMTVGAVTGTAAVSPVKPALPVGALELGTITIAAGTTSTNGAGSTIANTAAQTTTRGGTLLVRTEAERTALTGYAPLEVLVNATKRRWVHEGSAWRYLGAGPPPTYSPGSMGSGWSQAPRIPFCFVDSSGRGNLGGQVISDNAFSPNGTQPIISLPSQVPAPLALRVYEVPLLNSSGGPVWAAGVVSMSSDGILRAEGVVGGGMIGAASSWYLDGISWHPTTPQGSVLA